MICIDWSVDSIDRETIESNNKRKMPEEYESRQRMDEFKIETRQHIEVLSIREK
jgi:hypothetical protein